MIACISKLKLKFLYRARYVAQFARALTSVRYKVLIARSGTYARLYSAMVEKDKSQKLDIKDHRLIHKKKGKGDEGSQGKICGLIWRKSSRVIFLRCRKLKKIFFFVIYGTIGFFSLRAPRNNIQREIIRFAGWWSDLLFKLMTGVEEAKCFGAQRRYFFTS